MSANDSFMQVANAFLEAADRDSPDADRLLFRVIDHAPAELLQQMFSKALEIGLIPSPSGCLADGSPIFSLEEMARHNKISEDEANNLVKQFLEEREQAGLSNDGILVDPDFIRPIQ